MKRNTSGSRWRATARDVMDAAIETWGGKEPPEETLKRIDRAYPFGLRKHHPYKIWLEERRRAIGLLWTGSDALWRPCPACRARPGIICKSIGGDQDFEAARAVLDDALAENPDRDDETVRLLRRQLFHVTRTEYPEPGRMPLFASPAPVKMEQG